VLGCAAGIEVQRRLQRADTVLTLAQLLQQSHACRVSERAKELGLERVDGRLTGAVRHLSLNLTNFEDFFG
jgi:hypothetical protein